MTDTSPSLLAYILSAAGGLGGIGITFWLSVLRNYIKDVHEKQDRAREDLLKLRLEIERDYLRKNDIEWIRSGFDKLNQHVEKIFTELADLRVAMAAAGHPIPPRNH